MRIPHNFLLSLWWGGCTATSPGVQSQAFVFGGTGTDTMEQQPPGYEELFANQGGEGEEDGEDREESVGQGSAKEANSFKEMDGVTVARNSDGTFTVFSSGGGGTGVGGIPLSETRTGADVVRLSPLTCMACFSLQRFVAFSLVYSFCVDVWGPLTTDRASCQGTAITGWECAVL